MNRKLVVKNKFDKTTYCVLSEDEPFIKQLEKVLEIEQGHGFSIDMDDKKVRVKDYFTGETVGEFDIISFDDTNLPQELNWINV